MKAAATAKNPSGEPREAPKERSITLRAMLAAQASDLPTHLRHFVHVLALQAFGATGRGLSGQATLARCMGVSKRQIGRYWAELDARWNAGTSPVAAHREARHHNSDAYQLEVRAGAPLELEKTPRVYKTTSTQPEATPTVARSDAEGRASRHPRPTNYGDSFGAPTEKESTEGVAPGGLGGRGAPGGEREDLPYDPTPEQASAYFRGATTREEWHERRKALGRVAARRWPVMWAGDDLPLDTPRREARIETRRYGLVRCVMGEVRLPRDAR